MAQFKEWRNFLCRIPVDSIYTDTSVIANNREPVNNKLKQASLVERGKITVYVSDETYSISKYNSTTRDYRTSTKRRVVDYILTDQNRLIKLNYKHLKPLIHDNPGALKELEITRRGRMRKYIYFACIPISLIPLILDEELSKKTHPAATLSIVLVGTVGGGYGYLLTRMRNRGHLIRALLLYNHPAGSVGKIK